MDDTFRLYGNYSEQFKPLKEEEQNKLLEKYINGDKSVLDKLIKGNLSLVSYIINKYYYKLDFNEKEDLFQVGCIGLIKAIQGFNNKLGYKFSTYAFQMINCTIKSYKNSNCLINVPREMRNILYKIESGGLASYSPEEISKELNVDKDKINAILNIKICSLDDLANDEYIFAYDFIPSNVDIEFEYEEKEIQEELLQAISLLSERDASIVKMYYGINCKKSTQNEISEKYGVSQAHVSRSLKKACLYLKDILNNNEIYADKDKVYCKKKS